MRSAPRRRVKNEDRSGHCIKCGVFREVLHRDHILPAWLGGTDEESNVQYLCPNCHQDKTLAETRSEEWRAWRRAQNKARYEDPAERQKISAGWTPEARAKQSARMKQRFENPELRKLCGEKNVGVSWSEERRKAHSLSHLGLIHPRKKGFVPLSEKHRLAIAEGKRKRREFLASLTPQELAIFKRDEAQAQLAKLESQMEQAKKRLA